MPTKSWYGSPMAGRDEAPAGYDPHAFPPFAVTVDIVVITIADEQLKVLLIERGADPYLGTWALPGGFVHVDEDLDDAAARELTEETGVRAAKHLEEIGAYGTPDRDPRMRVVSIAYLAVVPRVGRIEAATDAKRAELIPVSEVVGRRPPRELAFDHKVILRDAVESARSKLESTSIATAFLNREFTLSELRAVYEIVWGEELDPGNFRRKVLATPDFVVATGDQAQPGPEGGKPAEIYRAGSSGLILLDPPLRRPSRRP
jgi:8-oxo-dGTP diphosphatase